MVECPRVRQFLELWCNGRADDTANLCVGGGEQHDGVGIAGTGEDLVVVGLGELDDVAGAALALQLEQLAGVEREHGVDEVEQEQVRLHRCVAVWMWLTEHCVCIYPVEVVLLAVVLVVLK